MKTLVVAAVALCSSPALAVTYALEDLSYNQAAQIWNNLPAPPISLMITPVAVARGSFMLHASTGPLQVTGDATDFLAFQIGSMTLGPSGYGVLYSHLDIALDFAADGSVSSGSIDWLGAENEFDLAGTAGSFGGAFSLSDSSACGTNSSPIYDCRLSGALISPQDSADSVAATEPRTALLLLPLVVYAAFASRRRACRMNSV